MSNDKGKPYKTQPHLTQKTKAQAKKPQPIYAYIYTRYNTTKYATQSPHNTQCHYQCMSHSLLMAQKTFRKPTQPQHKRHVSHTRQLYAPRRNRFANVECFYCMTKGHTSNVCFYRRLHLQLLPLDYFETNQPRPIKVWVQKDM